MLITVKLLFLFEKNLILFDDIYDNFRNIKQIFCPNLKGPVS